MIRTLTCTILVSLAALSAGATYARDNTTHVVVPSDHQQEVVQLGDVNFSDPYQVKVAYKRLRASAARVCVQDKLSCRRRALADAVAQVNQPLLTAMANGNGAATQMARAGRQDVAQR